MKTQQHSQFATTREDAETLVSKLLLEFTGRQAFRRLRNRAQFSKQSLDEVTKRLVTNLFTSLTTHKNT